jgi:hypothetical protein
MDGIPPGHERQTVKRHFYRRLFATGVVLLLPYIGLAQTTVSSGTQGAAASVHFQILDQKSVWVGTHSITLNRVASPVFPLSVGTPSPAPAPPPEYANYILLTFWATVYDGKFTMLQWSYGNENMVVVSNIDFSYFSSLSGFVQDNSFYNIIAFLDYESSADADPKATEWLQEAKQALNPAVPGYLVVSGTASADAIQGLTALHKYFGENQASLIQAYTLRQAQFAAEQLQLKLNPPVRPSTIINYWPIKSSVYLPNR